MSELDDALDAATGALGSVPREGQREMAAAVAAALRADDAPPRLLVQAGTGTGKSLAYLVPAALEAVQFGDAVIIATATLALQRQLVDRDLPVVAAALEPIVGREVTYAVLKGRHNYVCLERLHRSEPGEDDEVDALLAVPRSPLAQQAKAVREWALETETGDRDDFGESIDPRVWRGFSVSRRECVGESKCPYGTECFTVRRREAAQRADLVVTNHAMLAIDVLEGIPLLPEHGGIIVDEAHELVDRTTQALTRELSGRSVEVAAQRARSSITDEAYADLVEAGGELDDALASGVGRLKEPGRDLTLALTRVRDAARAANAQIASDGDLDTMAARQRARGALDEVFEVAGRLLTMTSNDVAWVDGGVVRMAPLSVSALLGDALFRERSVVLTSATLTLGGGLESMAAQVGLGEQAGLEDREWTGLDVGSPFDYAAQGILYVARHLPPPGRDGIPEEALDEIGDLVTAAGGRSLILCSSWRAVERLGEYLRVRVKTPVIVQKKGETAAPLVEAFSAEESSSLVGTLSLWQGVDVPGSTCSLVVIDRIPFPRPDDPLVSARQEAVDSGGGSGFRAVSVPKAALLLAQGTGRLIRSPEDRGVVAVLDPRLATAGYSRALRESLPPLWFSTDKATVIGALERLASSTVSPA